MNKQLRADAYIRSTLPVLYLTMRRHGDSFLSDDGHGHTVTRTGALGYLDGKYFDGTDDKLDLGNPSVLQITGDLTLIGWCRTTANGTNGEQTIISKSDSTGSERGYWLGLDNGKPKMYVTSDGATESSIRAVGTRNDDAWHMLAGAFLRSSRIDVYADGVLQAVNLATGSPPASIKNSAANAYIGYFLNAVANYFTGTIGDIIIYPRFLSATEIARLYLATSWRFR